MGHDRQDIRAIMSLSIAARCQSSRHIAVLKPTAGARVWSQPGPGKLIFDSCSAKLGLDALLDRVRIAPHGFWMSAVSSVSCRVV